jgi:hypothetical protein
METPSQASDANRTFGHGSAVIRQDVVSLQGQAFALEPLILEDYGNTR